MEPENQIGLSDSGTQRKERDREGKMEVGREKYKPRNKEIEGV